MTCRAVGGDAEISGLEFALVADDGLRRIAQRLSVFNDQFGRLYGDAWVKLLNSDRFDGPTGNLCAAMP